MSALARVAVRHPLAADIALLVSWPLLLLALDPEWVFTPLFTIDPWVYFGTFVNLPYALAYFGDTYYVGRLTWILPGYVAHAILPPVAANVCLHLAVFYAATIACYFCLKMTVGRRPAIVVSLMLGTYQPFLNAVGWDYVDGAGIAYFWLTLACGTAAAHSRRPLIWSAWSGVFAAACIFTNMAWLVLMPGVVVYLALLQSRQPFGQYVRRAVAMAAGTAAITVFCCAVFYGLTGVPWFFLSSVDMARSLASRPNPWEKPTYEWVWEMASLGTACAVWLISLISLVRQLAQRSAAPSIALHVVWLLSALALFAIQLSGTPVLQLSYYATYLIPGLALATGALLVGPLQRISPRAFGLTLGMSVAIWLIVVASTSGVQLFPYSHRFVAAASLVMFAAIAFGVRTTRVWPMGAGAACLLMLMVISHNGLVQETIQPERRETAGPGERQLNYRLTVQALEQLLPIQLEKPFYFWYPSNAPRLLRSAYMSTSSCYFWGYRLFSAAFPARTAADGSVNQPRSGQRIVLLTDRRPDVSDVEDKLGAGIRVVREAEIAREDVSFNMLVFDVR